MRLTDTRAALLSALAGSKRALSACGMHGSVIVMHVERMECVGANKSAIPTAGIARVIKNNLN